MGYEVKYHYHDKTESGYDTDDVKIFTKRVGKSFEDASLGAVASAIIRQLARRDIWVVNVEIVEFVKKEISFRESKGGIVIKNRKFNFDFKILFIVYLFLAFIPIMSEGQYYEIVHFNIIINKRLSRNSFNSRVL